VSFSSRQFRLVLLGGLLALTSACLAQLKQTPVVRQGSGKAASNGRTQTLTAMRLPFWDDFSTFNTSNSFVPNDTLWTTHQSVWRNEDMGIAPVSIGVATFDGLDSLGRPRSLNDVLAKGFSDRLVSRPLRLDLVPVGQRATVYLTFFFQPTGNGEPPDSEDQLRISFKDNTGQWTTILQIQNNALPADRFSRLSLPVPNIDNRYFHNNFQFRFENFARLSGPYDTWHLDYVYLNVNGNLAGTSFTDRAITRDRLTPLFQPYRSIPFRHARNSLPSQMSAPQFEILNVKEQDQQIPISYRVQSDITTYANGSATGPITVQVQDSISIGNTLGSSERRTITMATFPNNPAFFDPLADSIDLLLNVKINSGDNAADYDPQFAPMDFRNNDTLTAHVHVRNYYAYDDGTAEYGAGLDQPGSLLAYQFDSRFTDADTLTAVDLHFPKFGEENNQVLQLIILGNNNNTPGNLLHVQDITIRRTTQDEFVRYPLNPGLLVGGRFYVGWRQGTASIIAVGLDKSNDTGSRIFYNTGGVWIQNTQVTGSLMIRPVFGKSNNVTTSIEETTAPAPYPNPNAGEFYLPASAEQVIVRDAMGRSVPISETPDGERKKIYMTTVSQGLFVVTYQWNGVLHHDRIMVRYP
jgi:hypothetical protein